MAALFTAFEVSALSTNVTTILTTGVTLTLAFLGYKYIKRGSRAM